MCEILPNAFFPGVRTRRIKVTWIRVCYFNWQPWPTSRFKSSVMWKTHIKRIGDSCSHCLLRMQGKEEIDKQLHCILRSAMPENISQRWKRLKPSNCDRRLCTGDISMNMYVCMNMWLIVSLLQKTSVFKIIAYAFIFLEFLIQALSQKLIANYFFKIAFTNCLFPR